MTGYGRQAAVIALALLLAALLVVGISARARAVPEDEGDTFAKGSLSAEKAKKVREGEAALGERDKLAGPPEKRVDEDTQGNPYVAGELIVTYKDSATPTIEQGARSEVGAREAVELPEIDAENLSFADVKGERSGRVREEKLARKKKALERDPSVEAVDYNYVRHIQAVNDPLLGQQWGPSLIRSPQAWATSTGTGTIIADIDTGVLNAHPDLGGAVVQEHDYFNDDAVADDRHGHGTHVAGIAAARTNNATGIAGTSPAAGIFDYQACNDSGGCDSASWISALTDAANNGADVANLSLGGPGVSTAEENAVNYAWNKGLVVVASAGNEAQHGNPIGYPAAYPSVIAVGAVDNKRRKSSYSSYGGYVDVAAPGGDVRPDSQPAANILSTVPSSSCNGCYWWNNRTPATAYEAWAGTSMAAPHVTGLASLLSAQGLTASQVRKRIESTATDLGPAGKDPFYGKGLVNAHAAVTNDTAPTVSNPAPVPYSSTTNTRPTIGATVSDAQTTIAKSGVRLYLDGDAVAPGAFSYNPTNGRVSYVPTLEPGTHQVKVVVFDQQGMRDKERWQFTVL